jgi:hypothetical protein
VNIFGSGRDVGAGVDDAGTQSSEGFIGGGGGGKASVIVHDGAIRC